MSKPSVWSREHLGAWVAALALAACSSPTTPPVGADAGSSQTQQMPNAPPADAGEPALPSDLRRVLENESEPLTAGLSAFIAAYEERCARERPRDPDIGIRLTTWSCPRADFLFCDTGEATPHRLDHVEGTGARREAVYVEKNGGRLHKTLSVVKENQTWKIDDIHCLPSEPVVLLCALGKKAGTTDFQRLQSAWPANGPRSPIDEILAEPAEKQTDRLALIARSGSVKDCDLLAARRAGNKEPRAPQP